MKANPEAPDKFQAIFAGKKCHDNIKSFRIGDTDISCEANVSLLGVNIDFMLKFDDHVSDICKKASKQLAVLKRLGRFFHICQQNSPWLMLYCCKFESRLSIKFLVSCLLYLVCRRSSILAKSKK